MTWTGIFYHVICYLGFSKMSHTDEMFWSEFFHLRVCFKMDVLADVARDWLGWALAVFTQGCLSRRLPGSLNAKHGLPSSVCFFVSSPPPTFTTKPCRTLHTIHTLSLRLAIAIHLSITISTLGSVNDVP